MTSAQQRGKQILIVEDCEATREILTLILEAEGYTVAGAGNGLEALRSLQDGCRPCAILLDLVMPVMNGWEFLEQRQQDPRLAAIPVIVLSAVGDLAPDVATLGAAGCVTKPIQEDTLIDQVLGAVNSSCGSSPQA